jgi:hypothetical protein
MDKIARTVPLLAAIAGVAAAQCWSGSGPVTTTCNVGIGTTSPAYPLTAVEASGYLPAVDAIPSGSSTNRASIGLGVNSAITSGWIMGQDLADNGSKDLYWWSVWTSSAPLYISGSSGTQGYVGIGTTSPAHLLHVAGTIGAEEVIVSSNGADYVLDPGYRLKPLSEVSEYIKQNHHLPEIPPATEIQEKGVSVGEMQTKLLAKIEELTLHMIRAEEENRKLRERIERLEGADHARRD